MYQVVSKIQDAKHISIITSKNSPTRVAYASVFYSFLLQLHKKVSWQSKIVLDVRFEYIPWSRESKSSFAKSSDLLICFDDEDIDSTTQSICIDTSNLASRLYNFFLSNDIKINKKIATALYVALLDSYEGFMSSRVDASILSMARELIGFGANHSEIVSNIFHINSLAKLRLESKIIDEFCIDGASLIAYVELKQEMLYELSIFECLDILRRISRLVFVKVAMLLVQNKDNSLDVLAVGDVTKMELFSDFSFEDDFAYCINLRSFDFEKKKK